MVGFNGFSKQIPDELNTNRGYHDSRTECLEQGGSYGNGNMETSSLSSALSCIIHRVTTSMKDEALHDVLGFIHTTLRRSLINILERMLTLNTEGSLNCIILTCFEFYCLRNALQVNSNLISEHTNRVLATLWHETKDPVVLYFELGSILELLRFSTNERTSLLGCLIRTLRNDPNTPQQFLNALNNNKISLHRDANFRLENIIDNYGYKLTMQLRALLGETAMTSQYLYVDHFNIGSLYELKNEIDNILTATLHVHHVNWGERALSDQEKLYRSLTYQETSKKSWKYDNEPSNAIQDVDPSGKDTAEKNQEDGREIPDAQCGEEPSTTYCELASILYQSSELSLAKFDYKRNRVGSFLNIYGTRSSRFFKYVLRSLCTQLRQSITGGQGLTSEVDTVHDLMNVIQACNSIPRCTEFYQCRDLLLHLLNGPYTAVDTSIYVVSRYVWQNENIPIRDNESDHNGSVVSGDYYPLCEEDSLLYDWYGHDEEKSRKVKFQCVDNGWAEGVIRKTDNVEHVSGVECMLSEQMKAAYNSYYSENIDKTFVLCNHLSKVTLKLLDYLNKSEKRTVELTVLSAEVLMQINDCLIKKESVEERMIRLGMSHERYTCVIDELSALGVIRVDCSGIEILV